MTDQNVDEIKKSIIAVGRLLWEKDLTAGLSGNMSRRAGTDEFFVTATQTCLGLLGEDDIVAVSMEGAKDAERSSPSSEWRLHSAVYQAFPEFEAIVHVHTVHTNAFFLRNDHLKPQILESKHILGDVPVVNQTTLNVEDCGSVVEALRGNALVVLRNHGSLAAGENLFDCFVKLQTLEQAVKTEIICQMYS